MAPHGHEDLEGTLEVLGICETLSSQPPVVSNPASAAGMHDPPHIQSF